MEDLTYAAGEIVKGRNLPLNIRRYGSGLSGLYETLGLVKLSMDASLIFTDEDQENSKILADPRLTSLRKTLRSLLHSAVVQDEDRLTQATTLRGMVQKEVEILSSYIDLFQVYEYVLNRVEYRFKEDKLDEGYYGTYLTNDLVHYVFQDKNEMLTAERLREVIGQLPMRLSRQHFFDMLRNAFSLYKGAQKGTVDDFTKTVLDAGTLDLPRGAATHFPEYYKAYKTLAAADYRELTQEEFKRLESLEKKVSNEIMDLMDEFVYLSQMVNDLCTVLYARTVPKSEEYLHTKFYEELHADCTAALQILQAVLARADEKEEDSPDFCEEDFEPLEGEQERILMFLDGSSYAVDTCLNDPVRKKELEKLGAAKHFESLQMCGKLQSSSQFAPLVEEKERQKTADNVYLEAAFRKVKKALAEQFISVSQPVRRALMSSVIAELPPFTPDARSLQEYINMALELCTDTAERLAVVELMKEIMNDEME